MEPSYPVDLTDTAKAAYVRIYMDAQHQIKKGDESGARVKLLRMVDECLDKIIPHDPFCPKRALSGALSSIYRVKKGRLRICYIASSLRQRIIVLFIAETPRKEGDKNDPYAVFTNLVLSGQFDNVLAKLGVRRPSGKQLERNIQIN